MISRAILILCLAPLMGACASVPAMVKQTSDDVITTISRINNTAIKDFNASIAVAKAATPPDADGVNCAQSAITVLGEVNAVFAAAKTPDAGVFTRAELLSLFAPNSPQYNQVKDTLTTGCGPKVLKVIGAAQTTFAGGVVGVLAGPLGTSILPLAAAAP